MLITVEIEEGGQGTPQATVNRVNQNVSDGNPLLLQSSDHPGMLLVTTPLIGSNYLSWSRSMSIALGAKVKLGFINGKCLKPEENSVDYEQWLRVDCMVTSWILNSISKDLIESFLYATTAKELWDELAERFGESNGPLFYQIQREINSISQGNHTVAKCFTNLKRLWDELNCLSPLPTCTCGATKILSEITSQNRLIQFLMGLNDTFDHVRNQILSMDPFPNVNKAYSMVLRVEKQREVHLSVNNSTENATFLVKSQFNHKSN